MGLSRIPVRAIIFEGWQAGAISYPDLAFVPTYLRANAGFFHARGIHNAWQGRKKIRRCPVEIPGPDGLAGRGFIAGHPVATH